MANFTQPKFTYNDVRKSKNLNPAGSDFMEKVNSVINSNLDVMDDLANVQTSKAEESDVARNKSDINFLLDRSYRTLTIEETDKRYFKNEFALPTLQDYAEKFDGLRGDLVDIATNIQSETQLRSNIERASELVVNIGKPINITRDMVIPKNIHIAFSNNGKLVINHGVTLTINCSIEAPYRQIFEFVDEKTSILTTKKYTGEVKVDWFGADSHVEFIHNYWERNGIPMGKDSTVAFKKCMSFVQDAQYSTILYAPSGTYYVKGNNPCGLQKNINQSARFTIEGNMSRIFWHPTLPTDSLFGKLGLMFYSNIRNIDLITLGDSGDRKGIIFNTKLEFNNIHFFSKCVFENINVNSGTLIGCDKVFNFESDGTHSHDDLSLFKNITAVNYNVFVNILNNESVKNTFENCSTISYTNNAKTFKIDAPSFSGYMSIIDHSFIVMNNGEVVLQTSEQPNTYPIFIERPRLELRGEVLFTFCDLNSMDVYINGLSFILGGGIYNFENNYFEIGKFARLTLDRCIGIYGNVKLKAANDVNALSDALVVKDTLFYLKITSIANLTGIGFPNIRYDNFPNRKEAIAAGKIYKRVKIENPNSTNDLYNLPAIYSSTGKIEYSEATLSNVANGKMSIIGEMSMPSDMVIESLYIDVSPTSIANIDTIAIDVYKHGGEFIKGYRTSITANTRLSKELITNGNILTLPFNAVIIVTWVKNGVAVTNQSYYPSSYLKIKYRSIMTNHESNNGIGGEIARY